MSLLNRHFGGTESAATAISEFGDIAGWASTAGNASKRAFFYSLGVTRNLGTLGGASVATGVNDYSEIVGYFEVASGARHAFLYSEGVDARSRHPRRPQQRSHGDRNFSHAVVGFSECRAAARTRSSTATAR